MGCLGRIIEKQPEFAIQLLKSNEELQIKGKLLLTIWFLIMATILGTYPCNTLFIILQIKKKKHFGPNDILIFLLKI